VSVPEFFIFKNKNLPRVKLSSCHVAMTKWCGSDNATCQYYAKCNSSFSIWSLYSNFCLNL